jgi:hypothetical protein
LRRQLFACRINVSEFPPNLFQREPPLELFLFFAAGSSHAGTFGPSMAAIAQDYEKLAKRAEARAESLSSGNQKAVDNFSKVT